jgi:hypothetical protein
MKRFDTHGNELPIGVFQRKDRYHVLLSIKGVYASHGSFETIAEAKKKADSVRFSAGIEPAPEPAPEPVSEPVSEPVPVTQIEWDQETKKALLLLKIRNEIASKEAYIAMANMETAGVEWSHPWDAGWKACGKNIKTLIAELENRMGNEAQNGQS